MCVEVWSDDFGSISQTSCVVNFFPFFPLISLDTHNHQISMLISNGDDLSEKFLLGTICDSIYHALSNSIMVVCINTTKSNGFILSKYSLSENSSTEGNIFGMVFLNLYTKCCCKWFKCMFWFDSLILCGAFTEVYKGQFINMVKNILALWYFSFENWD